MVPKKIIALVFVSVLLIIIISSLIYFTVIQFLNSNQQAANTYHVLSQLDIVYSDIKDIETYTRGYIITGNDLYLESYNGISKGLKSDLSMLKSLVENTPANSYNNLENLIADKLKLQDEEIHFRKSDSLKPNNILITEEMDKTKMDEIRNIITGMKLAENDLLTNSLQERAKRTFGLFGIMGLFILLLMGTIISTIFFFNKELGSRRKQQDRLQEGLDFSNMIIDTVYTPLLVLDANLNIINENRSFFSNFNYTKEDIEFKPIFELIKGKFDFNDLTNRLRSIIPDNTSFENYELELQDNRIISMNARKLFRHIDNASLILVGIEDITVRKRIEEKLKLAMIELEQAQEISKKYTKELESINETKDKLFSIIAHDLRSPFQVLTSASNLLIDDLDAFNKEEIQQIAGELRTTVKTQHEVVDNLLTWVQLQRGRMQAESRRIFLFDKVQLVVEQLQPHLLSKNISVINNVPDNAVVVGDMEMLQIIFHNLIFNAVKFCNPGGNIELNAKKKFDDAVISVRDDGIGMDDELKKIIFTIDDHVKRPGTRDEKGTGLGLILSKEMVEKQGGKIWVESEAGIGTTFYFTLPCGSDCDDA